MLKRVIAAALVEAFVLTYDLKAQNNLPTSDKRDGSAKILNSSVYYTQVETALTPVLSTLRCLLLAKQQRLFSLQVCHLRTSSIIISVLQNKKILLL
jgi:hypothetical protein